mmetsp:Transcript_35936/g.111256  ORF Transcript_35936/g.111256 Transcript_35936/m.111256 type:complete len:157 (+) Transcript_35936:1347-1817(+)
MRRLLLARAAVAAAAGGIDQTIILIRHGEKEGDDLSPRGEQRANCLADHFANAGVTALYAYTDKSSRRSTETLTPLSAAIQVPINATYGRDDVDGLVAGLASLPKATTAVVCWEHDVLTEIATALGVPDAPDYPSDEYDWQWTVVRGNLTQADEGC